MGLGKFFKKLVGVAAPIVGGIFGGPAGAALGSSIGGAIGGQKGEQYGSAIASGIGGAASAYGVYQQPQLERALGLLRVGPKHVLFELAGRLIGTDPGLRLAQMVDPLLAGDLAALVVNLGAAQLLIQAEQLAA